jgi:hypothetical protein
MARKEMHVVAAKIAMTVGIVTLGDIGLDAQLNNCFIEGECPGIGGCWGTPEWVGSCTVYCNDGYPTYSVCSGG